MHLNHILAPSLAFALLVACGKQQKPVDVTASSGIPQESSLPDKQGPIARSKEECEALQGAWLPEATHSPVRCLVPTQDGGKSCKDSSECASICVAPDNAVSDQVVTGTCFPSYNTIGTCLRRVSDGKAGHRICRD
jgi:hypothetical protein